MPEIGQISGVLAINQQGAMQTRCGGCGYAFASHATLACPSDASRGPDARFSVSIFNLSGDGAMPGGERMRLVHMFREAFPGEFDEDGHPVRIAALDQPCALCGERNHEPGDCLVADPVLCDCGDGCALGACPSCDDPEPYHEEPYSDVPDPDYDQQDGCSCLNCVAASEYVPGVE